MRGKFTRGTIKNRIILTILLLIVVPSMIAFFSSLSIYSTRTNATAIDAKKQVLIQINKNINVNLNKYSELTMQLYYNAELVSAIGSREKTVSQRSLIREYLNSCVNSDANLTSAYVTMQDETILTDKSYQAIDTFFNAYQEKVEAYKGKMVWIPTQRFVSSYGNKEDAFVAARSIRKDNRQIGIIWLFINERFFNSLYDEGALSDGSTSVIISSDGAIINVTGDGALPDSFAGIVTERQGSKVVDIGGTRQLIVYSASSENDWVYINITPEDTILMGVRDIQSIILIIITLYAAFIILLVTVLNRNVVKPVQRLSIAINDFASGKMEASVTMEGDEEIRLLGKNFNDMVRKITALMEEVKAEEAAKNNARVRALSMQISPHFIYNTLNSIKWIAEMNKQENIRRMLQAMITFLKGVAQNNDFIALREELVLIESYLYIQKIRYMNFDVQYEIHPDTLNCVMGKLLLQPIVENAILHGIANEQNGLIRISSVLQENTLVLTVDDNGKGFDISGISEEGEPMELGHIGLANVIERIRMEHGEKYGVEVESKIGEGTKVTMRLPVVRNLKVEE
jgi:two-component system sensor histidine kinase YesM